MEPYQIRNTDWSQKYRPSSLDEMVLPDAFRERLKNLFSGENGMSLMLYGRPGAGKTTVAKLLNANSENNIFISCTENTVAMVRSLEPLCSSVTFNGGRRTVILDEADALKIDAQQALRGVVEKMSVNNDFIITANDPNKLSEAVRSRFYPVSFEFLATRDLLVDFKAYLWNIAIKEGYEAVDDALLITIVKQCFPDTRRMIKRLQFELT